MYTDPAQVAPEGTDPSSVYPNTFFLPPSGVQRGTTFIGGDPLSPTWTSVPGAYRLELNETTDLPSIPAQPVGYGDASRLMGSAEWVYDKVHKVSWQRRHQVQY